MENIDKILEVSTKVGKTLKELGSTALENAYYASMDVGSRIKFYYSHDEDEEMCYFCSIRFLKRFIYVNAICEHKYCENCISKLRTEQKLFKYCPATLCTAEFNYDAFEKFKSSKNTQTAITDAKLGGSNDKFSTPNPEQNIKMPLESYINEERKSAMLPLANSKKAPKNERNSDNDLVTIDLLKEKTISTANKLNKPETKISTTTDQTSDPQSLYEAWAPVVYDNSMKVVDKISKLSLKGVSYYLNSTPTPQPDSNDVNESKAKEELVVFGCPSCQEIQCYPFTEKAMQCFNCQSCKKVYCLKHNGPMDECFCFCPKCVQQINAPNKYNENECESCNIKLCLSCKKKLKSTQSCGCNSRKKVEDDLEKKLCKICFVKEKENCAFIPCGHVACCSECSNSFMHKNCPICREFVTGILKIYDT